MLTQPIETLLEKADAARSAENEHAHEGGALEISKVISAAAGFYEKVRYMVDYREEHTIRRSAIERILRRLLFIQNTRPSAVALLQELVEAKYLNQELASTRLIEDIDAVLAPYFVLLSRAGVDSYEGRQVVSFAATAVDEVLSPEAYVIDAGTAEALYGTVRSRVSVVGGNAAFLDTQFFCACYRSLLRSDDATLSYALWKQATHAASPEEVGARLSSVIASIKYALADDMQWSLARRMKDEAIYFRIILEMIREKGSAAREILSDRNKISEFTHAFLDERLDVENVRIKRSGIRAVLYLLFTKLILVAAIEYPYELFILGAINIVPLTINALFHPLLLFALTRKVSVPGSDNTETIVDGVYQMATHGAPRSIVVREGARTSVFSVIYFLMTLGLFGGIVGLLQIFEFNIVGAALFMLFLALVMYFAFRVRYRASQWKVSGEESGVFFVWQLLSLPIVHAGQWVSRTFSSINILVVAMDFILETPFRLLLNFSHEFLLYMREKADGVY